MRNNKRILSILMGASVYLILMVGLVILFILPKKYTVVFMLNNGSEDWVIEVEKNKLIGELDTPINEGYTFVEWHSDGILYDLDTPVTRDLVLKAVWKSNSEVIDIQPIIMFDTRGGSRINSVKVDYLSTVSQPTNPIRNCYIFVEWQLNGKKYNFDTKVTQDITLTALWKRKEENTYTVTFNTQGGSQVSSLLVKENKKVSKPNNPTKEGYTFVEWQLNGKKYNFNAKVTSDITLTAVWKNKNFEDKDNNDNENNNSNDNSNDVKIYTVRFDTQGGSSIADSIVFENEIVPLPTTPTKSGYIFVEWQLNGKKYNFDAKVTSDLTLTAVWQEKMEKKYTVKFDTQGGNTITNSIVIENETVPLPTNPTKSGYIFVEWQLNGKKYNFDTKVTNDITLTAVWRKKEANTYTVMFNTQGGTQVSSISVKENGTISKPTNPTRTGYTFVEWQLNGKTYNFDTKITKDITLVAKWNINKYIVNFDSNGGSSVASSKVQYNEKVSKPTNPTRTGYTFVEWQLNGKTYNFDTKVTKDITLVAKWNINKYIVKFDSNGGSSVASSKVQYNEKVSKPANPTRTGYTFVEWQLNGKTYNFNSKVTNNITLKAIWKKNYSTAKPSVPTVTYSSGTNEHKWQNNIKIKLASTHVDGISYYEVDTNNDGVMDKKVLSSDTYVPDNNTHSCNVKFRAVSAGGVKGDWTGTYHIHMDTEKPSKTIVSTGSYVKNTWTTSSVDRTLTATDNVGIEYYEFSNSSCTEKIGNEPTYIDSSGVVRPQTKLPLSGFQINVACHRAVDYAGNRGPWSDVTIVKIASSLGNNFNNKSVKAIFFGDSITAGYGSNWYSWANYIGEKYNIGTINMGAPGWCVTPSSDWCKTYLITNLIPASSKYNEDIDYVILHGGTNDIGNSSSMNQQFISGFENYLAKATKQWPNARIGYIITYKTPFDANRLTDKSRVYYNKMKEILNKWNISYIDLFDGSVNGNSFDNILNVYNPSVYMPDNLHLNRSGYEVISPYIYNWMMTLPVYSTVK